LATSTKNPTSDEAVSGTWDGSAGSRYTLVDDYPDSSGADFLTHGTATAGNLTFGFSAFSLPSDAIISNVAVKYYDQKTASQSCNIGGRLKVGGNYYNASTHNPANGTWTSRTDNWANNPKSNAAWTVTDINGGGSNALQAFGWVSTDANPTIRLASCQVEVTYTLAFKSQQKVFRFYEDGTEAGSTAIANQDTNITRNLDGGDSSLLLRAMIQEQNGDTAGPSTDDYPLYVKKGSGSYRLLGSYSPIDSYDFSNNDSSYSVDDSVFRQAVGQSFTGNGKQLKRIVVLLSKFGSPTGNAVIKIYAHSGTYGTSSIPTGAALATSDNFDVSTLTGSAAQTTFTFSGGNQITLTNGTYYIFAIEYTNGDGSNLIDIYSDSTSPGHSGNTLYFDTVDWIAESGDDLVFEVLSDPIITGFNSSNLTDGNATTNRLTGGSGSFVAGKISEDGEVNDLQLTAANYTELLYAITLDASELADGDTLDFRVYRNGSALDTYTVTPRITVSKSANQQRSYGMIIG